MSRGNRDKASVVVVGGGFAGVTCAKRLAKQGVPVTLIDRHDYNQFQPLLYEVATAQVETSEVARHPRPAIAARLGVRAARGRPIRGNLAASVNAGILYAAASPAWASTDRPQPLPRSADLAQGILRVPERQDQRNNSPRPPFSMLLHDARRRVMNVLCLPRKDRT